MKGIFIYSSLQEIPYSLGFQPCRVITVFTRIRYPSLLWSWL